MKSEQQSFRIVRFTAVVCMIAVTGCAATASGPSPVPEIRSGILQGYLDMAAYPNSLKLLPPPPTEGTAAQTLDTDINGRLLALNDTPRFALATLDNDLSFPAAAGTFSCALGIPITPEVTPYLYQLLRRSLADAGLATYTAKNHYQRKRPFLVNAAPNCASAAEQEMLTHDGSYPSGHTAIGWAWALILAGLAPERADEILHRGLAFGESRAICNVHWPSDVIAGRTVGAAAVAVLHADETFQHDLDAAGREIARARTQELVPTRDCTAEAEILGRSPEL